MFGTKLLCPGASSNVKCLLGVSNAALPTSTVLPLKTPIGKTLNHLAQLILIHTHFCKTIVHSKIVYRSAFSILLSALCSVYNTLSLSSWFVSNAHDRYLQTKRYFITARVHKSCMTDVNNCHNCTQ